jgi:hypothetical protein
MSPETISARVEAALARHSEASRQATGVLRGPVWSIELTAAVDESLAMAEEMVERMRLEPNIRGAS